MTASSPTLATADGRRDSTLSGSVILFFLITYAVSWTFFIASARALAHSTGPGREMNPLYLLGVFGPALAAVGLTAAREGAAGVQALVRRIAPAGVAFKWYAFAILFMPAVKLAVAVIYRVGVGAWPTIDLHDWYLLPVAILVSTPFQAGEEIGWRGYALPRLADRLGLAGASLLLGVVWAAWHLPFFFIPGVDKTGQSFPLYVLQVTALSVAVAWLYWRTGGNLLLTMLMHSATNQTVGIVPSTVAGASNPWALSTSPVAWITLALLWMCAARFLWDMRAAQ